MADNFISNIKFGSGKGETSRSRSVSPSKGKKSFEKILSKDRREGEGNQKEKEIVEGDKSPKGKETFEDVETQLELSQQSQSKKGVSLFDLANKETEGEIKEVSEKIAVEDDQLPVSDLSEKMKKESLSALFRGYGSKERLQSLQMEAEALQKQTLTPEEIQHLAKTFVKDKEPLLRSSFQEVPEHSEVIPQKTEQKPTHGPVGEFTREQPDLAAINPIAAQASTEVTPSQTLQQSAPVASPIQELAEKLIDKLYIVTQQGKTDTVLTLKHPPLFSGAKVVVTSYDSAKGELNVTFENLTQQAKQLLDMQQNQEALRFTLEQKGYTIHIITTTTITEHIALSSSESSSRDENQKGEGESQKEREQEKEEAEE